ncbi:MAG: peroxidase-related enzyme [Chloroflexota bacterium]
MPAQFTMDVLAWRPWLDTVDETGASPEQAELVDRVAPSPDSRPYYALLAHDLPALRDRTALFNAIMYGRLAVTRADRELAATAGSRVNGCVYCASVHARRYSQINRETDLMSRLLTDGVATDLPPRERAIVDFAVRLTADPGTLSPSDLEPMRQVGMSDAEILDIAQATAMFAWANRLMQTLGEPVPAPANPS